MQTFLDRIKLAKEKYIEQLPFTQQDNKDSKEFLDTIKKVLKKRDKNFVSLQRNSDILQDVN